MATTADGDVLMSDGSNGDSSSSHSTNPPPTLPTTTSITSAAERKISQDETKTRTDHDRNYYFTAKEKLPKSRPHATQNLIADYGLDEVHKRVRRVDPVSGEKINKLRKSYVGIVKNMHLAGSNKEVPTPGQWIDTVHVHDPQGIMDKKLEEQEGVDIVDGMQVPRFAEVWKVDVKPVSKQAASGLLAKLSTAVQMAPGRLDDGEKWRKLLGDDAVKKPAVPLVPSLKAAGAVSSARPSPRVGPVGGRTQRAGAKRSYGESSFSGYNETYDDVDGVSQADMARKKQRKVPMKSPKEYSPRPSKWKTTFKVTKAPRE